MGLKKEIYYKNIGEITPYENNPRKNESAVKYVAESIKQFNFQNPIIIDKNNVIVCGHTRYKAAQELGLKEVPCLIADDLTEEQIKAFRLADNKVGEIAEWDLDLLASELEGITELDMEVFGFDEIEDVEESEGVVEDDYNAHTPEEPKSKRGDIYQLGNHRLMCGDSTSRADVEKLMDGVKCDLLLTDHPYGIKADKGFSGAGGFTGKGKAIPRRQYNDDWDSFTREKECFDLITSKAKESIIFGGNFFTDKLPVGNHWIVWNKHNTMPTFSDAELAYTNIKRNSVKLYDIEYNGLIGKEKERFHPTQKPVKLMSKIIKDYTKESSTILDCFGGSGTTLMACEQLGRTCYMMEYEPKYIDVIIDRWEQFTGKTAVLLNP